MYKEERPKRRMPLRFRIRMALYDYFSEYTFNCGEIDGVSIILGVFFIFPFVLVKVVEFIFTKIVFPIILFIPNQIAKWINE